MIGVSSCLAGIPCRYNGSHAKNDKIKAMVDNHQAIAVCPELLAGLKTPRESCEIVRTDSGYKILGKSGEDQTFEYEDGAKKTLAFCQRMNIKKVIFKDRSPSCGVDHIYDGSFTGRIIEGEGIVTALLKAHGIEVIKGDQY